MVHVKLDECERLTRLALHESTGPTARAELVERLHEYLAERQGDPKSDPEETFQLIGLLLPFGRLPSR